MITNKGKELLARYLAGYSGVWAGAVEFGVGQSAVAETQESLDFPFERVGVEYLDYDPDTYQVTVRATIPPDITGEFHEMGVFSSEEFPSGEQGHVLLLDYSGDDTVYSGTNVSQVSAGVRVGSIGQRLLAPGAGTAQLRGFLLGVDLNAYTGNDVFNIAYNYTSTGGIPALNIRFESTLTDYFTWSFTPTAGYNIETISRQSLGQIGSPSWDTVSSVNVELDDQGDCILDGLMIEDTINIATYGMVARQILNPPLVKAPNVNTEITFQLNLGF